mmetsp:Transcript_30686/g.62710  ORF Transcript_30686/g.62710 Transcript_30686/m.62710 type:complete len:130 (+) Transcript_30686:23-412(+)
MVGSVPVFFVTTQKPDQRPQASRDDDLPWISQHLQDAEEVGAENMKGLTKADEPPEIDGSDETQPRRLVLRRHLDLHRRRRQDIDITGVDPRAVEAAKKVVEDGLVLVPSAVAVTAVVVVDPRRGIGKK